MWRVLDMLQSVSWAWGFSVFLLRCTLILIADYYIMYVRIGRVWLGKRNQAPSRVQGDLVMQLTASSPHHSTADEKTIFLQLNYSFIDRRLWAGLNRADACPSAIVTSVLHGGIGFYTALNLLLSGVNVHGVVRNGRQAERTRYLLSSAVERQLMLHKEWNGRVGRVLVHTCDMSDTAAVCDFSDAVAADPALRIIVCNSDSMCSSPRLVPQQEELKKQMAMHHVGHHLLLLRLLQNRLQRSGSIAVALPPPWRIVVVASAAAATANLTRVPPLPPEWGDQEKMDGPFNPFEAYYSVKMSELLFAFSLARFVERQEILAVTCTVNVLHPGPTRSSDMLNCQPPLQWWLGGEAPALLFPMTPVIASLYVVDLALSRRHERTSGHFFRMGQDQTLYYSDMVRHARQRAGFFKNSALFPGMPGPIVSLSPTKQHWVWTATINYLAAVESIDARIFATA
ncbi:hypothetical protein JKF63_00466 [Porcisia hertigi]|uniref:Uncharacterized protein n=1 Tax=Porcisia hertigi TaxID=2761500 RepID=A0A836I4Z9_9TRYP|nr:hypothetical protein JKF63_00466 [Porcisia hertigi]